MPLHDAFSAGSTVRLQRMSTVPTTEDLKYLLSETKKNAKPVELPFENNKSIFVIKVMLVGQAQTPRWTFQRGDGNTAKILWTRDSTEVLMIQSKIKMESASESGAHQAVKDPEPQRAGSESSGQQQPIIVPVSSRNYAGWPQENKPALVPPKPLPLSGFTADFVASKESWDQLKDDAKSELPASAANNLAQVRSFAKKTLEQIVVPALNFETTPAKGSPDSGTAAGGAKQAQEIESVPAPKLSNVGAQTSAKRKAEPSITIPLPPPVQFDERLVEHVFSRLFDRHTGLMSFGTLVFFLLREFDRFERKNTEMAIVICETAIKRGDKMSSIPYDALPLVAERIRSVCAQHHLAAHVSGSEFAILLDEGDDEAILCFCQSLLESISSHPLHEGVPDSNIRVAIGAASIPNTCSDPGVLVAAAEMAKEMAKGRSPSYLIFPARSDVDNGWS